MDIDKNGKITNYDIFPSYIKSRKKMTYDNVNEILENNHTPDGYEDYVEKLKEMQELAKILRKRKVARGYIEFDIPKLKSCKTKMEKPLISKKENNMLVKL